MTIEVVILGTALVWGGVEVMKHTLPSWYDKNVKRGFVSAHERIDDLENKLSAKISEIRKQIDAEKDIAQ